MVFYVLIFRKGKTCLYVSFWSFELDVCQVMPPEARLFNY